MDMRVMENVGREERIVAEVEVAVDFLNTELTSLCLRT